MNNDILEEIKHLCNAVDKLCVFNNELEKAKRDIEKNCSSSYFKIYQIDREININLEASIILFNKSKTLYKKYLEKDMNHLSIH